MTHRTQLLALCGLLFFVACVDRPLESAAPAVSLREYLTARDRTTCALQRTCCQADTIACEVTLAGYREALAGALEPAISAGSVVFDGERGARCLERATPGCPDVETRPDLDPCWIGNLITGSLPEGAPCPANTGDACAKGTFCDDHPPQTAATCVPLRDAGAPCPGRGCKAGLVCLTSGICGAPIAVGQPASDPGDCISLGLSCDATTQQCLCQPAQLLTVCGPEG